MHKSQFLECRNQLSYRTSTINPNVFLLYPSFLHHFGRLNPYLCRFNVPIFVAPGTLHWDPVPFVQNHFLRLGICRVRRRTLRLGIRRVRCHSATAELHLEISREGWPLGKVHVSNVKFRSMENIWIYVYKYTVYKYIICYIYSVYIYICCILYIYICVLYMYIRMYVCVTIYQFSESTLCSAA
jgi:hypothetical protein